MDLKVIIDEILNILTKEQEEKISDILLRFNEKRGLDEILNDNVCVKFQYYDDEMDNKVVDVKKMIDNLQEDILHMIEEECII